MAHYVSKQWIPVELEKVFPFFCDPRNFISIMPPEIGTRLLRLERVPPLGGDPRLAQAAGAGTRIEFSFKVVPLLPFRMKWLAEIIEFVPYSMFRDVQLRGPLRVWEHTHGFIAESRNEQGGTLITDSIRYQLGGGGIGALIDATALRLALTRTFAYRRKVIARLLAGGNA